MVNRRNIVERRIAGRERERRDFLSLSRSISHSHTLERVNERKDRVCVCVRKKGRYVRERVSEKGEA